ncbi:MAG: protoporphyrinogen oxidase [bacterium]|nr:protoporphyrinogen oxidase [bacterium]
MHYSRATIPRVAVVGAGVAGLATAFMIRELGRAANRAVEISIFEAGARYGGSTRTERLDGYLCEWGPNGFLDNEPATFDLIARLGLADRLVKASAAAANRYIFHSGKLHEVPLKPSAFLRSDILPLTAKLRMALELVIPAKRDDAEETVYSFGRRRLGSAFATYLLDPMVSGIFAGNTRELSLPAVFPKMVALEREYGGLFRAMFALQKQAKRSGKKAGGPAGASSILHTFRDGMGELTDALAEHLSGTLRERCAVKSVERRTGFWIVRADNTDLETDAVVLACPSFAAAEIIRDLDSRVSSALSEIEHAPVDVVCHGYRSQDIAHSLNGFGVLIPRSERIRILGCLWSDSIFPGQAPVGRRLLRTIMGGAHDRQVVQLGAEELNRIAFEDSRRLLPIERPPEFRKLFRHPRGIAQYTIGHPQRIAVIEHLERQAPGLFFTGASYRGVSVNGCAKDALRTAKAFWSLQGVSL